MDTFSPEMPRFEEFFNQKANGVHPFDKITNEINEKLKDSTVKEEEFDEWDRDLYEKEIMGRLLNRKLTPRQFEVITG